MKIEMLDLGKEINQSNNLTQHVSKYNSWVEIDTQALQHNLASYKNIIKPALLAPVIKSNAYGHGISLVASICEQTAAVDMLCVVNVSEALYLRSMGIKKPLLVLSILRDDVQAAILQDIQLVVVDLATAITLNDLGKKLGKKVEIHIKIDTGLSRLGFLSCDAFETITLIHKLQFIIIKGIFTHFADSENIDQTFTNQQIARFNTLIEALEDHGISIPLRHTSCSAAITANIQSHFTLSRVGIGIYGLWPSHENKKLTHSYYPSFSLKPALTWKTAIMQLKEIPVGSSIGYDCTHTVDRASMIAVLPIGYWDGYDRGFSNTGQVMIKNKLAPVVGRVAMNLTMIDVTDLDACVGDEVILLGNAPGVSAEDLAMRCQTINYEIVTRINPLLPRIGV